MEVFVTGGAGFLGSALCRFILARGHSVRSLDLVALPDPALASQVCSTLGDVRRAADVERAMGNAKLVIHAAAALPLWKASEIRSINVQGTSTLLEACARRRIERFILLSSTAVYGRTPPPGADEEAPLLGGDDYARSKIEAEETTSRFASDLCVTILRPKLILGPGRLGIFSIIFDWIRRGKHLPLIGPGTNRHQMLHVGDLNQAIWLAATGPASEVEGTFNLATNRFGTLREDFQALLDFAERGQQVIGLPSGPAKGILQALSLLRLSPLTGSFFEAADADSHVSIQRAQTKLRWDPVLSNVEMLTEAYDWYCHHCAGFEGSHGVRHGSPLRQGLLALARAFF